MLNPVILEKENIVMISTGDIKS